MSEDRTPTNPVLFGEAVRKLLGSTPVTAVMVSPVQCATQHMTRAQVAELMARKEISALPVLDDAGVVVGMVSKTDVVREDYGDARWQGAAGQVSKFMTPFVLRLGTDDSLAVAVTRMHEADVHHLVVLEHGGRPAGILSTFDVVRWLARFVEASTKDAGDDDETVAI